MRTLQALLDQAPTPLATLDDAGTLRAVNQASRRLLQTDDRVPSPPAALTEAIGAAQSGERRQVRLGARAARTFSVTVSQVTQGGEVLRLAALTDVQAELNQGEADALRQLLQVLGHEIMNSLTPIASLAETASGLLASSDPQAAVQAHEAVETIGRRASSLARFVQAYRTLARLPAPSLRPVAVDDLLTDVARLFRTRWPDVALTLAPLGDAGPHRMDPDLISQALLNLLANAAEAALAGAAQPHVTLAAESSAGRLALRIADNGAGVAPTHLDRLFQPFATTKAEGMGIGLSLTRQILRSHGGDVELGRSDAGGACFVIWL